jgi:modulator of FtsH protease
VDLYDVTEWHELFVASAGAAAALAGLVFVAVSINVERILQFHGLPERALQTILLLLAAVVVSILGLIPQSTTALGVELLLATVTLSIGLFYSARAAFDTGGNRGWLASRLVVVVPGSLPYLVCALSLLVGAGGGLAWIAAGIIGGMVGAVINAWVLLVEIRR